MEYFARGDIDGMMTDHYHDDAVLASFEFVLEGKEAIRRYVSETVPAQAGRLLAVDTVNFAESSDCILFTAVVNSESIGIYIARDAFYVTEGKIKRHVALTLPPKTDRSAELEYTKRTRALITSYFDSLNRGDWDAWLGLFDENVVVEDSLAPRIEGIEALRQSGETIRTRFTSFQNRPDQIIAERDKATAICRISAVLASNGASVDSPGCNYYELKNEKITYMSSYHDSAPWSLALGASPATTLSG